MSTDTPVVCRDATHPSQDIPEHGAEHQQPSGEHDHQEIADERALFER
jgi:hypothetical protein